MAFLSNYAVGGAQMVARKAVSSSVDVVLRAAAQTSSSASSSGSTAASTTSPAPASTTSIANRESQSGGGDGGGGGGGGSQNSSPLLFFVALGFGVVFTNLWIIVGVKYCFRYNARNRQLRLNEDGEPINLENMPRQHRRRREKKLMTMDEVNEKFPMQKYKNWVAGRAQEGLPTRGGVSSPQSRSGSIRDADGTVPELPSKERESTDERPATSATSEKPQQQQHQQQQHQPGHQPRESTSSSTAPGLSRISTEAHIPPTVTESDVGAKATRTSQDEEDEEEDDEHINAALPAECMGTSGDTCAICIDALEDDDDVRGLACGHAFHAACLDPWLTSRRACCPLCKADYYTPKPRAPAAESGDAANAPVGTISGAGGNGRHHGNVPSRPQATWIGLRGHGRVAFPNRFAHTNNGQGQRHPPRNLPPHRSQLLMVRGHPRELFDRFRRRPETTHAPPPTSATTQPPYRPDAPDPLAPPGRLAAFRSAFPTFRLQWRQNAQRDEGPVVSGALNNDVSPSNLEAAVRPAESR